jgi:hypothetical protein
MKLFVLLLLSFSTIAQSSSAEYIYYPELARQAETGNVKALRKVLATAEKTPPGEKLEELAEISSKFVRRNPVGFLQAQKNRTTCFGMDFMGVGYLDNVPARQEEIQLRITALRSVNDPRLASTKQRCLSALGGI